MIKQWLAALKTHRENELVEDIFNDAFGKPSYRHIRRWDLEELHRRLSGTMHSSERRMAESQVRIKEAWRTPARWSMIIASAALVVSLLALAVSIWG